MYQDHCAAHECCVLACPEVFNISSGLVALNDGAERFFASHAERIFTAAEACPVNAIVVEADGPPPPATEWQAAYWRRFRADAEPGAAADGGGM
ncbi:MAG: ferredoxin [Planctomycetota bacterium]